MPAKGVEMSEERVTVDHLDDLLSSARDVSTRLIAELEFAQEVVRDGLLVYRDLPRLIASWHDYLTRLTTGVYGDEQAPGGGLDEAPECT